MLQEVTRKHATINYTARLVELHDRGAVRKRVMSQYLKVHEGSCAMRGDTMQHSQEMTITVTVHDLTTKRWLRAAWGRHLRL